MDLRSLVGKLDNACRTALEQAAELALSRTDFNVEIEHWLIDRGEVPSLAHQRNARDAASVVARNLQFARSLPVWGVAALTHVWHQGD